MKKIYYLSFKNTSIKFIKILPLLSAQKLLIYEKKAYNFSQKHVNDTTFTRHSSVQRCLQFFMLFQKW